MASDPFGSSRTPSTGGSGTQVGSATTPTPTCDMQLGEVPMQAPTQGQETSSHGQDAPHHNKRDILVIPVSTVSSEFAFNTGGRVLGPFHSSLHPTTVEALICTQNWIKTPKES